MDPFSLEGKNIVITGASSGIGRQCAISCSMMNASVILIARREKMLQETLSAMKPGNHLMIPADVTDFDKIASSISSAVDTNGRISGMVHCAGVDMTLPVNMLNKKVYDQVFPVNVFSALELVKVITNRNVVAQSASIVFISSIMALAGNAAASVYSATKGALVSSVKSLAVELAPKKIRINSISPGLVNTELFQNLAEKIPSEILEKNVSQYPLGIGTPEDVANACIYMLSDASKWITGTNLVIDGGYTAK